jgi:hypothetical protein
MAVFIALPLLQRALEEVFGDDAPRAQLRDLSAFHDLALNSLMERVHEELLRRHASALFLQGIAQAIATQFSPRLARRGRKISRVSCVSRFSSALRIFEQSRNRWSKSAGDSRAQMR